jgi:hypothetical protein
MPAAKAQSGSTSAAVTRRREKVAEQIDHSLEKTQEAVALLRSDLGRDGKRIAVDIEKLLRHARRDLEKLPGAIRSDVERTAGDDGRRRSASPKSPGRRTTSARSPTSGTRSRASSKR